MTEAAIVLAALLALAAVAAVARPLVRAHTGSDRLEEPDEAARERLRLVEERDRALAALRELEFDHRTGKVSDADYHAAVGPLRRRVAEALRSLDPPRPPAAEPEPRVVSRG